jgi:hypothetical protein
MTTEAQWKYARLLLWGITVFVWAIIALIVWLTI